MLRGCWWRNAILLVALRDEDVDAYWVDTLDCIIAVDIAVVCFTLIGYAIRRALVCAFVSRRKQKWRKRNVWKPFGFLFRRRGSDDDDDKTIDDDRYFFFGAETEMTRDFSQKKE